MSTATTTSLPPPPAVTVLPGKPDNDAPKNWFEENPLLLCAIIISVLVAAVLIYHCWKRIKRRSHQKVERNNEAANSQVPTSSPLKRDGSRPSFCIIRTPEAPKMEQLTNHNINDNHSPQKPTLAVPPAYVLKSQRSSAPSRPEGVEQKPTAAGRVRWSTGLNPQSLTAKNVNSQRTAPPAEIVLSVPMLYRRISYGQNHAVYAPEPVSVLPAHPEYLVSTPESIQRVGGALV
ncbi:unnamed protein product [Orchesella dallaii]|uniref:Uncharacterized protein n=1 Tax=Orchesella dallaii TaxID=48710 RepID=A0ABP1QVU6_9HEXA